MINQFDDDELDLEEEQDKMKLEIARREKDTMRVVAIRLRKILRKNEDQLTLEDKKFLKARASYLTKGQREEYAHIINADYSGQKSEEAQVPKEPETPKLEKMTRPDLEAMARDLGIGAPEELPNKDALIAEIKKYQ